MNISPNATFGYYYFLFINDSVDQNWKMNFIYFLTASKIVVEMSRYDQFKKL